MLLCRLWRFSLHQPNNGSFCQKIESIQYQAALAIYETLQTKLYQKVRILSMKLRQWFWLLSYFPSK